MDQIDYESYSSSELLEAEVHTRTYYQSYITPPMVLRCAIELGIPDVMLNHGEPITLSELVASLPMIHPTKTHCLHRLLRILVHTGFFAKHVQQPHQEGEEGGDEEKYSLTLALRLLPKERWPTKPSLAVSISYADSLSLNPMLSLSTWFKNSDRTVLETAQQSNFWDLAKPETKVKNSMFNEMMERDSRIISTVLLREHREVLEGVESLVDVGGGTGTMVKAIAKAFPHMKCTVLDVPKIVGGLQGTTGDVAFVAGDMFEAIPPANAILLKVLYLCQIIFY